MFVTKDLPNSSNPLTENTRYIDPDAMLFRKVDEIRGVLVQANNAALQSPTTARYIFYHLCGDIATVAHAALSNEEIRSQLGGLQDQFNLFRDKYGTVLGAKEGHDPVRVLGELFSEDASVVLPSASHSKPKDVPPR